MNRRSFLTGTVALAGLGLAGCNSTFQSFGSVPALAPKEPEKFKVPYVNMSLIPPQFHRRRVKFDGPEKAGSILVDTGSRHLFFIEEEGTAVRYGIGVGRQGFEWKGTARVGYKRRWPTWTPPSDMIRRQPELAKYSGGMPGGPRNPLGARALYLYQGGRDTLYRLHGTNEPRSIGKAMSSGCIRMLNQDVIDLYERAPIGTRVKVV